MRRYIDLKKCQNLTVPQLAEALHAMGLTMESDGRGGVIATDGRDEPSRAAMAGAGLYDRLAETRCDVTAQRVARLLREYEEIASHAL